MSREYNMRVGDYNVTNYEGWSTVPAVGGRDSEIAPTECIQCTKIKSCFIG